MTNIDDSTQTPPGYWFGVIEGRLHERMREALADLGLRRGSWRILHTLADGPATADELAERMPHGDTRGQRAGRGGGYGRGGYGHGGDGRGDDGRGDDGRGGYGRVSGHGYHPGWRGQEPRDEHAAAADGERQHAHEGHHNDHQDHHDHHHDGHGHDGDFEHAFERGYERGFDRGFAFGAVRGGHPAGPFPGGHGYGPFPGWHGYGPFPGWHAASFPGRPFPGGHGYGSFPGAAAPGHPAHPFADHQRPCGERGSHRGHRIHRVLADFVERGWVWFDGDRATLTDEGRAAHDNAFERVQTVRAELANGIPEGDFEVTLATLETMARNLGWRPAGDGDGGVNGGEKKADGDEGASGSAPSMDA
ncbi:hypothetical protein [Leifsonia sp. 2MCAF36]|uniref:hypothetical protein n=1 Tax=Leifsonia sp. 2MCAF36 TaxID=3232988 RepID=UPI003F9A4EDF